MSETATSAPGIRCSRLEQMLVEQGLLTPEQRAKALLKSNSSGRSLADILVSEGMVPGDVVRSALSEIMDIPAVNLDTTFGDPLILDSIPKEKAFELKVIPLFLVDKQLTVAMADPEDLSKLNELRFLTGKEILPVLALESDLDRHVAEYYGELDPASGEMGIEFEAADEEGTDKLEIDASDDERPIIRLVNLIIARAIQEQASDIHLEPQEGKLQVRFRVDGRLQPKPFALTDAAGPTIISRLKILSRIDITERRIPQDGKVRVKYRGRNVDIRVSTFPTIYGEKVVLRLLDKERQNFLLETLEMSEPILRDWKRLLRRRQGILLVTGPTGSGKSSTLYATLRHLNRPDVNIVTLEDPVEYELAGISQAQINPAAGFTFANGLRSILRQDPDMILVGEIRDAETAQIAVQAAQTGHLVLATLHTNDAPSAVIRLADMGLPRYLIAAGLIGVMAQRLVRRVCTECAEEGMPGEEDARYLRPWLERAVPYVVGKGCDHCLGTGFKGRVGVQELLTVTPAMQQLIAKGATKQELAACGQHEGYRKLWWDGLLKVKKRLTTLGELASHVEADSEALFAQGQTAEAGASSEEDHAPV